MTMHVRRFVTIFAISGLVVPLIFCTLIVLRRTWGIPSFSASLWLEPLEVVVWPTSLLLLGFQPQGSTVAIAKVYGLAIASNVVIYSSIGAVVGLAVGYRRQ